jgi:hypothetical protein
MSINSPLRGYALKKAHGATVNSSTTTFPEPRCDSNSLLIIAARSRSWELPGRPGPTSVQIV